jgi:hypothetical protein
MRLSTLNSKAGKGSIKEGLLLRVDPLQEELQCMRLSTLNRKAGNGTIQESLPLRVDLLHAGRN